MALSECITGLSILENKIKPFNKITQLDLNMAYQILGFESFIGKYGRTVSVELKDSKVTLPKRYQEALSDEKLTILNKGIAEKAVELSMKVTSVLSLPNGLKTVTLEIKDNKKKESVESDDGISMEK